MFFSSQRVVDSWSKLQTAKLGSLPGFSTAITLAFLQIFGMECVAMILEKNLDSQVRALGPRFFKNSTPMLS